MNPKTRHSTLSTRLFEIGTTLATAWACALAAPCSAQVSPSSTPGDLVFRVIWKDEGRADWPRRARRPVDERSVSGDSGFALFPAFLAVDADSREATVSNSNGVLEPGEFVVVETGWYGYGFGAPPPGIAPAVSGTLSSFTGPADATYSLEDATANFGDIYDMETKSCADGSSASCYTLSIAAIAARPATHWDGLLSESLSDTLWGYLGGTTWRVHVGESFPDVPTGNPFYAFIETVLHNEVTVGCAGGGYCPQDPVTRGQMAVFLLKARYGSAFLPPPCTGHVFSDVPCTGGSFDPWIEELASLGITAGCGGSQYCPGRAVTREQMAPFLLKTREGSEYLPPACIGLFDDVACTPGVGFSDWVEELSARSIAVGCSATPALYCPSDPNTRGQMAAFLTRAFGLALYGP